MCHVVFVNQVSDLKFSVVYVLIQSASIFLVWHVSGKKLGVYLMFLLTFSLFIGGRFFAYLLNPSLKLDIFAPTFFFDYFVSIERKQEIFSFVIFFIVFSTVGYSIFRRKEKIKPYFNITMKEDVAKCITKTGNFLFPFFAIGFLYSSYIKLMTAMSGGGYLSLYLNQSDNYEAGGSFIPNLMLFFFAFAFVYGNKALKIKYLILYLSNSVLTLMIGSRGGIGALFLFIIWLYSLKHKIKLLNLFFAILVALIALFFLFSFSVRANEEGYSLFDINTLLYSISYFAYTNGISLMVFDASRLIDSYPFIAYVQTFIPGATFFWGLLGNSLAPQDIMFSYRMCYELNPSLFVNGSGLGWTILSDLYVFSFGNIILFIALSLGVGCLFGMLENFSEKYKLYSYITFYVFMKCMLLPRGAGLIPELVYGLVYLLFFCVVFYFLKNYGRSKQQCLQ